MSKPTYYLCCTEEYGKQYIKNAEFEFKIISVCMLFIALRVIHVIIYTTKCTAMVVALCEYVFTNTRMFTC